MAYVEVLTKVSSLHPWDLLIWFGKETKTTTQLCLHIVCFSGFMLIGMFYVKGITGPCAIESLCRGSLANQLQKQDKFNFLWALQSRALLLLSPGPCHPFFLTVFTRHVTFNIPPLPFRWDPGWKVRVSLDRLFRDAWVQLVTDRLDKRTDEWLCVLKASQ